ncbi:hypothetical protein NDI39_27510 [Microcoleus sp. ZQ-A2]|nr:hypothetical protein [Microcoleus sp. FACHB-1]
MSQLNVPASTLHRAIAAVAEYLEDEFSPELFAFMDGGQTLDICSEALSKCQTDTRWQTLAREYESLGGSISCPDQNDWEVA